MRDNSKRPAAAADVAGAVAGEALSQDSSILSFATPTELVDLPSRGRFYPEGHPLHMQETVEIKFMTAKDEDILTSPTLLKKGIALDRFIQNVLVDKRINVGTILSGDKNAILLASRINGFGADYQTMVTCPNCSTASKYTFDLSEVGEYLGDDHDDYDIEFTDRGTFMITLPVTKVQVEGRFMNSRDEMDFIKKMNNTKDKSKHETLLTDQLKRIIVSINGISDRRQIEQAVGLIPALDSRHLRAVYAKITPGVEMSQDFACPSCGFEKEVDIPMTVDFFWSGQ